MQYTKYVQLRNQHSYYFRFKVPARLQKYTHKTEFIQSLQTDSLLIANAKVAIKLPAIHQLETETTPAVIKQLLASLCNTNSFNSISSTLPEEQRIQITKPQELLLSEAWQTWSETKDWSDKISKGMENYKDFVIALWGDVSVYEIDKSKIKQALAVYAQLPLGNKKPFNTWSMLKKVKFVTGGDVTVDVQSSKSVKNLLSVLQGFFSSYLTNDADVLSISPTLNIKYKFEDFRAGNFTNLEMKAIINYVSAEGNIPVKFGILVAIFTGMRRSEIVKALELGIKQESDSGIYYLDVVTGKTKNAIRQVPIPDVLLKYGILDVGAILLKEKTLSLYIQKLMLKLSIPVFSVKNEKRTLHSLRHTFISVARKDNSINLSLLQEVIGHSKGGGLTDRYTHTFDLKYTKAVVETIQY